MSIDFNSYTQTGFPPQGSVRPLCVSDAEIVSRVENKAFPPAEACNLEKIIYRLSTCPELSLGLFLRILPGDKKLFYFRKMTEKEHKASKKNLIDRRTGTSERSPIDTFATSRNGNDAKQSNPFDSIKGLLTSELGNGDDDDDDDDDEEEDSISVSTDKSIDDGSNTPFDDTKSEDSSDRVSRLYACLLADNDSNPQGIPVIARPSRDSPYPPKVNERLIGHILGTKFKGTRISEANMDMPDNFYHMHPNLFKNIKNNNNNNNNNKESLLQNSNKGIIKGHDESGDAIGIHSLVIDPEFHGYSLGSALMVEYIQRMAGQKVAKKISIICHNQLVSFYSRLGFTNLGKSDNKFANTNWFDMSLDLDKVVKDVDLS